MEVTKETFEQEVLQAEKSVLAEFGAPWCGYCRMLEPVMEKIAEETDTIKVVKINTDKEPELAKQYDIMGIPVILAFKNGELYKRAVGFLPKEKIIALLD